MAGGRLRRPPRLGKKTGRKGEGVGEAYKRKNPSRLSSRAGRGGAARDGSRAPSPVGPERIVGLEFDAGL